MQCSILPGDLDRLRRDDGCMNQVDALFRSFLTAAVTTLPVVAAAATELLDQSTRRPSVARLLVHSLQAVC